MGGRRGDWEKKIKSPPPPLIITTSNTMHRVATVTSRTSFNDGTKRVLAYIDNLIDPGIIIKISQCGTGFRIRMKQSQLRLH